MRINFFVDPAFRLQRAFLLLFVLLLPTLLFVNNEAIWDDQYIIADHAQWSIKALLGPYAINSASYWRPLTVISISLPYLAGLSVSTTKVINLVIFFIQGCLTLSVLNEYLRSRSLLSVSMPLMTLAVVLALSPIFVETYLWISARADLLLGCFVLLAVHWILRAHEKEKTGAMPENGLNGLLRGFAVVWLACAAKDTGVVWVPIVLVALYLVRRRSNTIWNSYWWNWILGVLTASVSYFLLRTAVLGIGSGYSHMAHRAVQSGDERFRLLVEFVTRSILNIFLPFFDQAPVKSPGWYAGLPLVTVFAVLVVVFIFAGLLFRWMLKRSATSAWLALSAVVVIISHALMAAFIEPSYGSLLADRYLSSSAALLYLAFAMIMSKDSGESATVGVESARIFNLRLPVLLIFTVLNVQSASIWVESRVSWSTNLGLWENSWNFGSHTKIVAENLSNAQMYAGNPVASRKTAITWINEHHESQARLRLCAFYKNAVQADILLKQNAEAFKLSVDAVDIGWCDPSLSQNISFMLIEQRCDLVLPMINHTLAEGSKPRNAGIWMFDSFEQKEKFLLLSAYAEARCGQESKALEKLAEVALRDNQWMPNGPMASGLMNSAHASLRR